MFDGSVRFLRGHVCSADFEVYGVSNGAASDIAAQLALVMGAEAVADAQFGASLAMECTLDGGFELNLCRRTADRMRNAGMRWSKGRIGSNIAHRCAIRNCEFHRPYIYVRMPSDTFTAA